MADLTEEVQASLGAHVPSRMEAKSSKNVTATVDIARCCNISHIKFGLLASPV